MKARKDIERRIEKEQQNILDLQKQINHLEAFIKGLQEALKMLPKDDESIERPKKGKGTVRPGSDMDKIRLLIETSGHPMHVGEIVTGLGKPDTKENRMSITGSLGRYVRKGIVFSRPGPNQFSLISLSTNENTENLDNELPPEFGSEEIQK